MQRYWQTDLSAPPTTLMMGDGELRDDRQEWIQPLDRWTLILYGFSGLVHVNIRPYSFTPGTAVLFAPGCRASHSLTALGGYHKYATFWLPKSSDERMAVPSTFEVSSALQEEWQRSAEVVGRTVSQGKAFVWNLLWQLARPLSVVRTNAEIYEAEDWIRQNLAKPFKVVELADAIGVSQSQLLRVFHQEHGVSAKQYVLDRRVREAVRLLSDTDLSVKAVASKIGVPDVQQFNKLLRTRTGLSPRKYRGLRGQQDK